MDLDDGERNGIPITIHNVYQIAQLGNVTNNGERSRQKKKPLTPLDYFFELIYADKLGIFGNFEGYKRL